MDKKNLSESDISDKYVRPALVSAGWHTLDQIYAQFPLRAGRVVVRGNRSQRRDTSTVLKADFVLCFKPNIPLAVVEVKKARLSMQAGMQQAIQYAELLDVPFSFASNGDGFVFRDATLATACPRTQPHTRPVPKPRRAVDTLLRVERLEHRGTARGWA
jgi:type I restriction enzyme R subunit